MGGIELIQVIPLVVLAAIVVAISILAGVIIGWGAFELLRYLNEVGPDGLLGVLMKIGS